ncbi:MAG TPA: radical SAM family heme chaperone HemW [Acidimicrobiales bacterium]|nr:radical SAM family heme chaperone HemW [Acidimicrobiales bacterium]
MPLSELPGAGGWPAPLTPMRVAGPAPGAPGSPSSEAVQPFGVYVHVPFCARRCDYCAFATWTDRHHLMASYTEACVVELDGAALAPATSVFFGGGTPSLLPPERLAAVLDAVPRSPQAEVTVECNPEDATAARLDAYRGAGVTRLSFGVQSTDPSVLVNLGRNHGPGSVAGAVAAAAEAGFGDRYSVDLIYGAAGETPESWRRTLESVLAFDPPPAHVSAYALTVEPGTPLSAAAGRHPDSDDQADKYITTEAVLADHGLDWYEISNWARPGAECRHNQLYWAQGTYRGIGCAAHSHGPAGGGRFRRWWNVRTPQRYQRAVAEGRSPVAAGEVLEAGTRRLEGLQLGLRTRAGVPSPALDDDPLLDGLVERRGGRAVLTVRGRLLANEVAMRLTA